MDRTGKRVCRRPTSQGNFKRNAKKERETEAQWEGRDKQRPGSKRGPWRVVVLHRRGTGISGWGTTSPNLLVQGGFRKISAQTSSGCANGDPGGTTAPWSQRQRDLYAAVPDAKSGEDPDRGTRSTQRVNNSPLSQQDANEVKAFLETPACG